MNKLSLRILKFFVASIFCIPLFFGSAVNITRAQTVVNDYVPLYFTPQIEIPNSAIQGKVSVAGVPDDKGIITSTLLAQYIQALYNYGLSVGGILAAIMLMAGGILWLVSAGDSGKIGQAKDLIMGSIVGIFILFGAYLILNTINPKLVQMKGVEVLGIKAQTGSLTTCCNPKQGPISFYITTKDGKSYFNDDKVVGEKTKKGMEFVSCWDTLLATNCTSGSCQHDEAASAYICYNPEEPGCCTCRVGNAFFNNKYTTCTESKTKAQCTEFCNQELAKYSAQDKKDYTQLEPISKPPAYTCQSVKVGTGTGRQCTYSVGGTW
jgi:hypothetical protein